MLPLSANDWSPILQPILDDMHGQPLRVHGLMANQPALLSAWWNFRNYGVSGGGLTQPDCERIILRVAWNMGSWYEWASHVDRGRRAGLLAADINAMREATPTATQESAPSLLRLAVDELMQARGLSAATADKLSAFYTQQQIMDVIAIHGMYVTLGNMIGTWGLELDPDVAARLPRGETEEAFLASVPPR